MNIELADFIEESVVDGPGFRQVIFVQGCLHHCKGCHNPKTWPLEGNRISIEELFNKIKLDNIITGITYSGGEPFLQCEALIELSKLIKSKYINTSIWTYTGYLFEDLLKQENSKELLNYIDVLIDGLFILEKRDLSLLYKGSSNQRIIDVKKSLNNNNNIQLYEV